MRSLIWLVFLFFLLPGTLAAQDVPKVEIFGGYSYFHMPSDIFFDTDHLTTEEASLNGWNVTVTGNLNRWLGAEFDFGGYSGTVKTRNTSTVVSIRPISTFVLTCLAPACLIEVIADSRHLSTPYLALWASPMSHKVIPPSTILAWRLAEGLISKSSGMLPFVRFKPTM